ncbi:MAG: hypothetical protein PUB00_05495 [Clostridiales bacterium]|nr:hypothetical protein [Clostridiales bacterium]
MQSFVQVAALDSNYNSYTYDSSGNMVPSPLAYTVSDLIIGSDLGISGFQVPTDLFADENAGLIYLADTGNNRIVVFDKNWELVKIIETIPGCPDGVESLNGPEGVFVDRDGMLYICDTLNHRVLKLQQDGSCISIYSRPDTDLLEKGLEFKPRRLVVDQSKNIYLLAEGVYNGFIKYNSDGEFQGFYGGNKVEVTAEVVLKQIWRKFFTDDQIESTARILPVEYSNACIDEKNFIYTVVLQSSTSKDQLKRLNAKGNNVLRINSQGALYDKNQFGDLDVGRLSKAKTNRFVAVDVAADGIISILDQERGHIFQYDGEGNLLFVFGKKGDERDSFQQVEDIVSFGGKYLVLDSVKNRVTVFTPTEYALLVKKALDSYADGDYENAIGVCHEVLKHNVNSSIAYTCLGNALLQQGEYSRAMEYLKLGQDRGSYSNAYRSYRLQFVRNHFGGILIGVVMLAVLLMLLKRVVYRWIGIPRKKRKTSLSLREGATYE